MQRCVSHVTYSRSCHSWEGTSHHLIVVGPCSPHHAMLLRSCLGCEQRFISPTSLSTASTLGFALDIPFHNVCQFLEWELQPMHPLYLYHIPSLSFPSNCSLFKSLPSPWFFLLLSFWLVFTESPSRRSSRFPSSSFSTCREWLPRMLLNPLVDGLYTLKAKAGNRRLWCRSMSFEEDLRHSKVGGSRNPWALSRHGGLRQNALSYDVYERATPSFLSPNPRCPRLSGACSSTTSPKCLATFGWKL